MTIAAARPITTIRSTAPIRICDNGCWTDTWFAGHGQVFNIAVTPRAEVEVAAFARDAGRPDGDEPHVIHAESYADRYEVRHAAAPWGRHPLLEAAIAAMSVPRALRLAIRIRSDAPAGAGTGTSAAVVVALVGALDALTPGRLTPHEAAAAAHRVETEMLRRQCGIQDQLASAHGGVSFIEMPAYPHATVSPLPLRPALAGELERRLVVVYLGRAHDSSAIHESVIRALENAGPDASALVALRRTALRSRDAILAADLAGLGRAMVESTEAQGALHEGLVSADARRVIAIARDHGALGFKVNGAGGEGGSLTLLCGDAGSRPAMIRAIEAESRGFREIPIALSPRGLQVWVAAG